jgi:hypothetical protein
MKQLHKEKANFLEVGIVYTIRCFPSTTRLIYFVKVLK